ncbi:MAG: acetyl-CoA carboxylase biotin carboxyl carrier protein subunit [Flavobacteriales bacterium]|nr:acetyl-CoA carboxylase biotin carboxyl carrier protein subunit [Flavobacteriales bacterium]
MADFCAQLSGNITFTAQIIYIMYKVKANEKEFEITAAAQTGEVIVNGNRFPLHTEKLTDRYRKITLNGKVYDVLLEAFDKAQKVVTLRINGERKTFEVKDRSDELLRQFGIHSFPVPKVNELKSPMPGLVVQIPVKAGDTLSKGDPVLVLEAMKMENVLKAPADVVIKSVHCEPGQAVEKNAVLVRFE